MYRCVPKRSAPEWRDGTVFTSNSLIIAWEMAARAADSECPAGKCGPWTDHVPPSLTGCIPHNAPIAQASVFCKNESVHWERLKPLALVCVLSSQHTPAILGSTTSLFHFRGAIKKTGFEALTIHNPRSSSHLYRQPKGGKGLFL